MGQGADCASRPRSGTPHVPAQRPADSRQPRRQLRRGAGRRLCRFRRARRPPDRTPRPRHLGLRPAAAPRLSPRAGAGGGFAGGAPGAAARRPPGVRLSGLVGQRAGAAQGLSRPPAAARLRLPLPAGPGHARAPARRAQRAAAGDHGQSALVLPLGDRCASHRPDEARHPGVLRHPPGRRGLLRAAAGQHAGTPARRERWLAEARTLGAVLPPARR